MTQPGSLDDLATELETLQKRVDDASDILSGWMRGGTYLDVPYLEAVTAEFVVPPLESLSLSRTSSQLIVTGSPNEPIQWDQINWNTGQWQYSTSDSSGRIYIPSPPEFVSYLFAGYVVFASNSDGFRLVEVTRNRVDDTQSGRDAMATIHAASGAPTVVPFLSLSRGLAHNASLRVQVDQNGSANLDLTEAHLTLIQVSRL